jgi:hypothetical protein
VFNVTGFTPSGPPGSSQVFEATTTAISITAIQNDPRSYQNTANVNIFLRNCTYGEKIGVMNCLPCPDLKFLIEPAAVCEDCPIGGICPGGDRIWLKPDFYRTDSLSAIVYPCPLVGTCLGNDTGYMTLCADGYTGILCSVCQQGYTKNSNGQCNKCPSPGQNVLILILIASAVVLVCVILVRSSIKSAYSSAAKHSIYIKIFTNYIQLVFLTTQLNLKWPSYVIQFFGIQQGIATASDSIFSLDCYLSTQDPSQLNNSYYNKLLMHAILPFIIFTISPLVWLGICMYKEVYGYMKREMLLTMIVIFFLVYPNIVQNVFSHFSCTYYDQLGFFLDANLSVECWGTKHTNYGLLVALPSIIVWDRFAIVGIDYND